jgi:ubiquitin C-terminal hydrolase
MSEEIEALQKRYFSYSYQLDKDEFNPSATVRELLTDLLACQEDKVSAEMQQRLLNQEIPLIVKALLERKYYHVGVLAQIEVNDYLALCLQVAAKRLSPEYIGLLDVVRRLLNDEKDFYDIRFTLSNAQIEATLKAKVAELPAAESFATIKSSGYVNPFFFYNLDQFGLYGGFDKLIELLRKATLNQMSQILYIFLNSKDFMSLEKWTASVEAAHEAVTQTLLNLTDEGLRTISKEDLKSVIDYLQSLLDRIYPEEKLGEILESFELNLALKCLKSPYLEKRINGLREIIIKISQAKRKDEEDARTSTFISQIHYRDTAKWLNTKRFLEWADTHQPLQIIYGDDTHPELVKRSAELLRFLYLNQRLSRQEFDVILDSATGRHEAERDVIFGVLQDVMRVLEPADLVHFFQKLSALPLPKVDPQVLALIKSIAASLSDAQLRSPSHFEEPAHEDALEFLWSLTQEEAQESGLSQLVSSQALVILGDLLCVHYRSSRQKFMLRCGSSFVRNKAVLYASQLLQRLTDSYPVVRLANSVSESKCQVIRWLDKEQNFLSEVFYNFLLFKRQASILAQELLDQGKPSENTDCTSTCSSGEDEEASEAYDDVISRVGVARDNPVFYNEELKLRLDFLKYICSQGELTLQPKHVELLWECFVVNAFTTQEQEDFFAWVTGLLSAWQSVLDSDSVHMLFTDYLVKLDPRYLTKAAFDCFEKFFLCINQQHGLIARHDFTFDPDVQDINLLGLEALWEILLQAYSPEVSASATSFFKKLYQGLRNCTVEAQEGLLKSCMNHIRQGADNFGNAEDIDAGSRVARALSLLSHFITEFEGKQKAELFEVQINNTTSGAQEPKIFKMQLDKQMKLSDAREAIGKRVKPELTKKQMLLIFKGKILQGKFDSMQLENLNVGQGTIIIVTDSGFDEEPFPNEEPEESEDKVSQLQAIFEDEPRALLKLALSKSGWEVSEAACMMSIDYQRQELLREIDESSRPAPAQIRLSTLLSNTHEYFELLFTLLEKGSSSLNLQTWHLLNQIPVNQELYHHLKTLEVAEGAAEPVWEELLDPHCLHKLLYSLQIVNSFVGTVDHDLTLEELKDRAEWRAQFLLLGGFKHLYAILMSAETRNLLTSEQRQNNSKCLGFLLSVVKLFLQAAILSESSAHFSPSSPYKLSKSIEIGFASPMKDVSEQELPSLIKELSGTTNLVIEVVDFPRLIHKLLDIVSDSITLSGAEALTIFESAFDMLLPVITYKPQQITEVYSRPDLESLVLRSLLHDCPQIRSCFRIAISSLCEAIDTESPAQFFTDLLLRHFPQSQCECDDYFELTASLMRLTNKPNKELLDSLLQAISQSPIVEDRSQFVQDKVMAGHMQLAAVLASHEELMQYSEFLNELFESLFEMPEEGLSLKNTQFAPPKFKHKETRRRAFELLLALCSNCNKDTIQAQTHTDQNSQDLVNKLYRLHAERRTGTTVDTDSERKNSKYVGLRNFGCTCYMNSLMQQLYMMPHVRNGILEAAIQEQEPLEDSLLYQFQFLLAHLQESEKRYYSPLSFCKAFKDYDGQSMNLNQQQDVDEFFNVLFDKLENSLRDTDQSKLIRDLLGGTIVHEIVSTEEEFPYRGEREEQFFRLSLEIKNKSTLAEALDLYVKEDLLEGNNKYDCEQHGRKVNAQKRCMISSLANTVVIHLKRFEFDFTTMQRYKINDSCEFPVTLNFRPWAKPDAEFDDDYYTYDLAGVLVHSGIADAGHYYSYIKDRQTGQWHEFNDKAVTPFNAANLKEECFGGTSTFSDWQVFAKSRNAYMLFYERSKPLPVAETSSPEGLARKHKLIAQVWQENLEFLRDSLFLDAVYFEFIQAFVRSQAVVACPDVARILSESHNMRTERHLAKFFMESEEPQEMSINFILNNPRIQDMLREVHQETALACMEEEATPYFKVLKFSLMYTLELFSRTDLSAKCADWIKVMAPMFQQHAPSALWATRHFNDHANILKELLLENKSVEVRSAASAFVLAIFTAAHDAEKDWLFDHEDVLSLNSLLQVHDRRARLYSVPKAASNRFVKMLCCDMLMEARVCWRRYNEYFALLRSLANLGSRPVKLLLDQQMIYQLMEFFSNGHSPFINDKYLMGDQLTEPDMELVVELLSQLIRSCITPDIIRTQKYSPTSIILEGDSQCSLDPTTNSHLQDYRVFRNLLQHTKVDPILTMTMHLSWGSSVHSEVYLEELLTLAMSYKATWHYANPMLKIAYHIMSLPDDLMAKRVKLLVTVPVMRSSLTAGDMCLLEALQRYKDMHSTFTLLCISWWRDLLLLEPMDAWAKEHVSNWRWMVNYLQSINLRYIASTSVVDHKGAVLTFSNYIPQLLTVFEAYVPEEVFMSPENSSDDEKEEFTIDS